MAVKLKCNICLKSKPLKDLTIFVSKLELTYPKDKTIDIEIPMCRDCIKKVAEDAGFIVTRKGD